MNGWIILEEWVFSNLLLLESKEGVIKITGPSYRLRDKIDLLEGKGNKN